MDSLTQAKHDMLVEQGVTIPKVAPAQMINDIFNQQIDQWKKDDLRKLSSKELKREIRTLEGFLSDHTDKLNTEFYSAILAAYKEVLASRATK